jgi:hypothetical protein
MAGDDNSGSCELWSGIHRSDVLELDQVDRLVGYGRLECLCLRIGVLFMHSHFSRLAVLRMPYLRPFMIIVHACAYIFLHWAVCQEH